MPLVFPEDFKSPVPSDWTPVETALALELGVSVLIQVKARTATREGASQSACQTMLRHIETALRSARSKESQELLQQAERNKKALEEANTKLARADAEMEAVKANMQAKMASWRETSARDTRIELDRMLNDRTKDQQATIQELENRFKAERVMLTSAVEKHERDMNRISEFHRREKIELAKMCSDAQGNADRAQKQLEAATKELAAKNVQLGALRVSSIKGEAKERELECILEDAGLFCYNTSKGKHNKLYHDLIVSSTPLLYGEIGEGIPVYRCERSKCPRIAIESKDYKKPGALTSEVKKFVTMRAKMIELQLAEAFCFVATVAIPGKRRREFEVTYSSDGRPFITAYLAEYSDAELIVTVNLIALIQEQLLQRPCGAPAQDADTEAVQALAIKIMDNLHSELSRCDAMCRNVSALSNQVSAQRSALVGLLLSQYIVLRDAGLVRHTDENSEVYSAVASLDNKHRKSTCKILTTQAEHAGAVSSVRALVGQKRHRNE